MSDKIINLKSNEVKIDITSVDTKGTIHYVINGEQVNVAKGDHLTINAKDPGKPLNVIPVSDKEIPITLAGAEFRGADKIIDFKDQALVIDVSKLDMSKRKDKNMGRVPVADVVSLLVREAGVRELPAEKTTVKLDQKQVEGWDAKRFIDVVTSSFKNPLNTPPAGSNSSLHNHVVGDLNIHIEGKSKLPDIEVRRRREASDTAVQNWTVDNGAKLNLVDVPKEKSRPLIQEATALVNSGVTHNPVDSQYPDGTGSNLVAAMIAAKNRSVG